MKAPHLLSLIFLLLLCSGASAQECSLVSINGPESTGEIAVVFKARLNPTFATVTPQYHWKVSSGTITAGENTSEITLDTTGLEGTSIDVTVETTGVVTSCSTIAKLTVRIIRENIVCGIAFDEYGDIKFADEKARLDNFAIQLLNQPASRGYLLAWAGQRTYPNEALDKLKGAKNYLVKVRGIKLERLVTLDLGHRTDFTIKLYILPPNVESPFKDWTEHIPVSKLDFGKPQPKQSRKRKSARQ